MSEKGDIADRAARAEEMTLHDALVRHRIRAHTYRRALQAEGWCHYCGDDVEPRKLFCSAACASGHEDEHQRKTKAAHIAGRSLD